MSDLPPVGAHLVTPRGWYNHHGIHIGHGRVVHYSGFCEWFHRGPVEEVSLEEFTLGQPYWVKKNRRQRFTAAEIVTRARSRLGENSYDLFRNNCEHFCEWCVAGRSWSAQAEAWLKFPFVTLMALLRRGAPRTTMVALQA